MKRLLLFPYTFVLMNWAAMKALYCFLRHRTLDSLWSESPAVAHGARRS
jgi:hypothetical protein